MLCESHFIFFKFYDFLSCFDWPNECPGRSRWNKSWSLGTDWRRSNDTVSIFLFNKLTLNNNFTQNVFLLLISDSFFRLSQTFSPAWNLIFLFSNLKIFLLVTFLISVAVLLFIVIRELGKLSRSLDFMLIVFVA